MELQKAHVFLSAMSLIQVFPMVTDLDLGWIFSSINSQVLLDLPVGKAEAPPERISYRIEPLQKPFQRSHSYQDFLIISMFKHI